jgi:hypothetical protein
MERKNRSRDLKCLNRYQYTDIGVGTELSVPVGNTDFRALIGGFVGRTIYDGKDPFFEGRRRDDKKVLSLSFEPSFWEFFSYFPSVGVTYEKISSSLDYYSYDSTELFLRFRSRY